MISIIIPTYNRPEYLKKLLKSIKNQTYKNYEVLVIDDNSNTKQENQHICNSFEFVKYFENTTGKGAQFCRNLGIKKSNFNILCFCDDDDTWEDEKLKDQLQILNSGKFQFVYTRAKIENSNGDKIGEIKSEYEGEVSKNLLNGNFIPSSSVMIEKECFTYQGLFDTSFPSCQDWEMWYKLSKKYKFGVAKKHLVNCVIHDGPTIGKSKKSGLGYIKFTKKYAKDYISQGLFFPFLRFFLYGIKKYLSLGK